MNFTVLQVLIKHFGQHLRCIFNKVFPYWPFFIKLESFCFQLITLNIGLGKLCSSLLDNACVQEYICSFKPDHIVTRWQENIFILHYKVEEMLAWWNIIDILHNIFIFLLRFDMFGRITILEVLLEEQSPIILLHIGLFNSDFIICLHFKLLPIIKTSAHENLLPIKLID